MRNSETAIKWAGITLGVLLLLVGLAVSAACWYMDYPVIGSIIAVILMLASYVYTSTKAYAYRYMFPGLLAIAVFVVAPLIYTFYLSFTNYGGKNLKEYEIVRTQLLSKLYKKGGDSYNIAVLPVENNQYRLLLTKIPSAVDASIGDSEDSASKASSENQDVSMDFSAEVDAAPQEPIETSAAADTTLGQDVFADSGVDVSKEMATQKLPQFITPPFALDKLTKEISLVLQPVDSVPEIAANSELAKIVDAAVCSEVLYLEKTSYMKPALCSGFDPLNENAEITEAQTAYDAVAQALQDQQSKLQLDDKIKTGLSLLSLGEEGKPADLRKEGTDSFKFAQFAKRFEAKGQVQLVDHASERVIEPNFSTGFWKDSKTGKDISTQAGVEGSDPEMTGFRVGIGFGNYTKTLLDKDVGSVFLKIFGWNIIFSLLSVLFTLALGCLLAVVTNWESLRGRGLYRALLFLPYAVPGFISILVFKGMFRDSGEINLILNLMSFGSINWGGTPLGAKAMLLLINTWLGYPYMMLLCQALIKAISADLYEASALAGAGPITNFFKITAPLIVRPIMPLLVASFAFNFNNFVLVQLLTAGRPDFLNSSINAGETDLLVTFTYKLAFESGANYGLAAAISTIIFVLVVIMSIINMKITDADKVDQR